MIHLPNLSILLFARANCMKETVAVNSKITTISKFQFFISINFSVDDYLHEILLPLKFMHKVFTLNSRASGAGWSLPWMSATELGATYPDPHHLPGIPR